MIETKRQHYEVGKKFRANIPFTQSNRDRSAMVHVHAIVEGIYQDQNFIVYKVFGKHRRWWHVFMCEFEDMDLYIHRYKEALKDDKKCGAKN